MISGKQNILSWFDNTDKPYWTLYDHNKTASGVFKGKSNQDEGATHKTAMDDLQKHLALLSYGKYTLVATEKPGGLPTRGFLIEDFELSTLDNNSGSQAPVINGIPDGYIKHTDVATQIADALNKYKTEEELKKLKEENSQLKKDLRQAEQQDGFNRLAGIAADLFPMYKDRILPAVAGLPDPLPHQPTPMPTDQINEGETVDLTPEQQDRLGIAIGSFMEAAPDEWLELLERLAANVKSNPALINTFKAFL